MTDRPTPESVISGWLGRPTNSNDLMNLMKQKGMVVGYPDDPEVFTEVLNAEPNNPSVLDAWLSVPVILDIVANLPEVRRAVLAALPEEAPVGFYSALGAYVTNGQAERAWRWLREEAFRD